MRIRRRRFLLALLLVSSTITITMWYHLNSQDSVHEQLRREPILQQTDFRNNIPVLELMRNLKQNREQIGDSKLLQDGVTPIRRQGGNSSKPTDAASLLVNEIVLTHALRRLTPVTVVTPMTEVRRVQWKPNDVIEDYRPDRSQDTELEEAESHGKRPLRIQTLKVTATRQVGTQPVLRTSSPTDDGKLGIREPCSLPQKYVTQPLEFLLQQQWMGELKKFLCSLNSTLVSMVSSDYSYREMLLNWLISAMVNVSPPLSNILVLSLDRSLHGMLRSRGITSVHIPPESLMTVNFTTNRRTGFHQVHIMRLTVMRLINHWGYDVANYDTDAFILRNPEPLYGANEHVDFIGSYGNFPKELAAQWGIAVCIGVVLIRGTELSEMYWEKMSHLYKTTTDDQFRLNYALKNMGITWTGEQSIDLAEWTGTGIGGFTAKVFPTSVFCRTKSCIRKNQGQYYTWHQGGDIAGRDKLSSAKHNRVWYLKDDWEIVSNASTALGAAWLRELVRPVIVHAKKNIPSKKKSKF